MCNRFTLRTPVSKLAKIYDFKWRDGSIPARSNICPTTSIYAVRCGEQGRELANLKWAFLPLYAKTEDQQPQPTNATAEKVATSGMYQHSFNRKRCIIPSDGWYEWKDVGPDDKERYLFRVPAQPCFGFAGIWSRWQSKDKQRTIESCAIITTVANDLVASIHVKKRMPVILRPEDYGPWLDHEIEEPKKLLPLLQPFPDAEMEAIQVPRMIADEWFDSRYWPHLAS